MEEITSSMKLGTLSVAREAPSTESAPSRSTRISNGTPNTPEQLNNVSHLLSDCNETQYAKKLTLLLLVPLKKLVPEVILFDFDKFQQVIQLEFVLQGRTV